MTSKLKSTPSSGNVFLDVGFSPGRIGGLTMGKLKLRKWDSAEHMNSDEDIALYLDACLVEAGDDPAFIAKALGNIARARGMSQLARETGLGRESLYKALSGEGNPSFATILKVINALGVKLHAQTAQA